MYICICIYTTIVLYRFRLSVCCFILFQQTRLGDARWKIMEGCQYSPKQRSTKKLVNPFKQRVLPAACFFAAWTTISGTLKLLVRNQSTKA